MTQLDALRHFVPQESGGTAKGAERRRALVRAAEYADIDARVAQISGRGNLGEADQPSNARIFEIPADQLTQLGP